MLVVAPGQQGGAGGRADRCRVERVVAYAVVGEAGERGGLHLAAEGGGQAEADIVEQDDQDVGGAGAQMVGFGTADMLGGL